MSLAAGEPDRLPRVQSVDRAMSLLRAVAGSEGSSVAALAEQTGLNRATAWRLLHTLEAHGLVDCERDSGQWSIGLAVVELAESSGAHAVLARARPVLHRLSLETGETAALAVWRGGELTYVDEARPPVIVAATWLGQSVPLHATSTGKVLLAWGPETAAARLPRRLERFTDTTITSGAVLDAELETTRTQGYARCRGEYEATAWGVSAPVLDARGRLLAVMSVWGPGARLPDARLDVLGPLVSAAATSLLTP